MFIDTHCHLYKEYYKNIDNVINESIKNGVIKWLNNGCNQETNEEVLDLIQKYQNMYGALGIHPEEVLDYEEEDLKFIEKNINMPKVIAIGEIGLDYRYGDEEKNEQIELLEKELQLAEKYNKPVIIHSRDATKDTISILKKYHVKGVIHSFAGSLEDAKTYINMGYLLGVNGIITFKNADIVNVIREIPLEYLLLETDSPYLTPVPFRGKQNEPSHIIDIAKFVANLKNISLEEVSKITVKSFESLFKI